MHRYSNRNKETDRDFTEYRMIYNLCRDKIHVQGENSNTGFHSGRRGWGFT